MKNKILITIQNLNMIKDLKKLGITNYVYPIKGFTVGIPNTFSYDEITEAGYIYINRILDNEGINTLKKEKENIINNKLIKGIIFDDLGVLEVFKDTNLEKILYMTHFLNSSLEVNEYLKYVDTVILSTDITYTELENISKKAIKKISLFTFGLVSIMYSRRHLINNYSEFYKLEKENPMIVKNNDDKFMIYENEFGTTIYHDKYLYDKKIFNIDAKYYFYHPIFLNDEEVLKILNDNINDIDTDTGFLYKETIVRIKEGDLND